MGAVEHRLTVGDEHDLDGEVEERPEGRAEAVAAHSARQVAEPGVGTETEAAGVVAEEPVAGMSVRTLGSQTIVSPAPLMGTVSTSSGSVCFASDVEAS